MKLVFRGATASVIGRVAGLTAIGFLQTYWFLQPAPPAAKGLVALILLTALVSPAVGLLVFAGLAPISTYVATLVGGPPALGPHLLAQMAMAIGAGTLSRGRPPGNRTRLGPPAVLLTVVAVASAAAVLPAVTAPVARTVIDRQLLDQWTAGPPALVSPAWPPVLAAIMVAQCALLGWSVERTIRSTPQLATRLVAMSLAGHAAAGILNFEALLASAQRSGDVLTALAQLLRTVRLSMQTDVHAAASSLLLAGLAGLALLGRSRLQSVGVSILIAWVGIGLWITGSRVAIVLGLVVTLVTGGWLLIRGNKRRLAAAVGVGILAVAAGLWLTLNMRQHSTRHGTISNSVNARVILTNAGFEMFRENPIFGIGITRFLPESPRFIRGQLGENYRENAHNNFLQTLAEQGLVGLCAMLWWLGLILVGAVRAQLSAPTAARLCLIAAFAGCVGTWLTGHPLLVPEFAFVFWLYSGVLAAMTPLVASSSSRRWVLPVAVSAVLASAPLRAHSSRKGLDLEYRGFDLSAWHHDDSQRYREARTAFALYLQATGAPITVPIRRAPGAPDPIIVEVYLSEQKLADLTITGDAWQSFSIAVPQGPRRFELVDFRVRLPPGAGGTAGVLLRIGRTVPG